MQFTQEQLQALADLPVVVIQGVIMVDGKGGSVQIFREFLAVGNYVAEAEEKYQNNLLVQQALHYFIDEQGNIKSGMEGEAVMDISANDVLSSVDYVMNLLPETPEKAQFKVFIYELAQRVADAAGQGLLGSGARVTEEEAQFLAVLRAHLGV